MQIFRRRKSKYQLHLFKLQIGNSYVIIYFSCVQIFFCLKIRKFSVPKTFPWSKFSVTFDFNPTTVAKSIAKPDTQTDAKSDAKRCSKSNAKPKAKRRSQHCLKEHKYDCTQAEHIDYTLELLDTLSLPAHYKTKHLLDNLADLLAADLPTYVPDCVRWPELVSLNAVNIQKAFMLSADILPWYLDNNDPSYRNREC